MFGTFKRWVGLDSPAGSSREPDIGVELVKSRSEQEAWKAWQDSQPPSHFHHSATFQSFRAAHPEFQGLDTKSSHDDRDAIAYCFGDYQSFVPCGYIGSSTCERLLKSLIDLYDSGKGLMRIYLGDPPIIAALRICQLEKSSILSNLTLRESAYDYTFIHAHTAACYSLSTLVLLLAVNLVAMTNVHSRLPQIDVRLCERCRREKVFGEPYSGIVRRPLPIPGQDRGSEGRYGSLPEGLPGNFCSICDRATEKIYGRFRTCYDCYTCKICKVCGLTGTRLGTDRLPRCDDCS